ncbi:MAG: GcvT family protein [Gammaproteobacteria bacterium]
MRSQARVVIVGGGVVGVSTLYHLVKKGWSEVMLLEQFDLTHGSTWHAAGLLSLFNMSYSVGQIHKYSVDLYKSLEAATGQDVSFHVTGNLRLATNRERMDEYKKYCGTANTIGVPFELITAADVKALWPLCETEGLVGALYHPHDGHIAPADLTQALAIGARRGGAEINRQTEVTAFERTRSGQWLVKTTRGDVRCEHVVTACGSWAREVNALAGLAVPTVPVEHQYIVTEEVPELMERHQAGLAEMAVLRESDASYYLREERQGYILGPYEKGAPAWAVDGVPGNFVQQLLPGDLDRLEPHIEAAIKRVPTFGEAGIKDVINGPIPYTPDGSPLIGPAPGARNFWWNEGHSFGITAAGGAGWQLAEWIVEGEPGIDMMGVEPRRFGAYANRNYLKAKNEEAYEHVFIIHYPDEERPAGRPAKTSPIHSELDRAGAVWGQRYGWERPNWFAPPGAERVDDWSFRRSRYFEHVGNEHRAVRERAGLIDISGFSKFELSGPGAEAMLEHLLANRMPKRPGRITLAHALTANGGVRSEFTVTRDAQDRFYLVSSGAAEIYDYDLLAKHLPVDGSVRLDNVTGRYGVLVLAGPKSRDVLRELTNSDLSSNAFPWLTSQDILVGVAPVRAMRVNFVGDLGWELHHPIEYQHHIYRALVEAGEAFGLAHVGMRAMDSLRIEKSYRMWAQDLSIEYSALASGLDRFVRLDKDDFIGKVALERQKTAGVPYRFVTLECEVDDADALGNEPIWSDGSMVGRATAGAYGHYLGKSLALGYVKPGFAHTGTRLEIEILRERFPATVVDDSPYDPDNKSLRA